VAQPAARESHNPGAESAGAPRLTAPEQASQREAFYAELAPLALKPLWTILRSTLTDEPARREIPYVWRWRDVRPHLLRAGELVTAEEAERRVLMFINPGHPQKIGSTATLYAAMQLILPGETAPAHRHTPTALRFIVEGKGGYTCVEGVRIDMERGDLVLTPSGAWHDHGNDGDEPVMWMDGLDIPVMVALNCMFFEHVGGKQQQRETSRVRERLQGRALFPGRAEGRGEVRPAGWHSSPVWSYRWREVSEALELMAKHREADPYDGFVVSYVNPATGGEVLPSIGCRAQLLPAGLRTRAQRSTASAVYHVVEGSGESVVAGVRIAWQRGDTFAVPIWCWSEHAATTDAKLFSFNDVPLVTALGHLRHEAMTADGGRQAIDFSL
jgi:gentisate 1,2-dioxygenase